MIILFDELSENGYACAYVIASKKRIQVDLTAVSEEKAKQ